ncbi:helix-turn-helix domain-containing protein [Arsenophonus sp. PmNCSU2021_1]|uniref:helix-turn-helix domain-containing protein n=1 Tax=Arsenophonus sp. PmNCSU2021_1 TaxID=3118989 RepID=UPI002FF10EA5
MTKKPSRTFLEPEKEPVIERIFQLVDRYSSRSEAARAWGINVSTLKNYYKRRHLKPSPRRSQLLKIAEHEGVSLNWLLNGEGDIYESDKKTQEPNKLVSNGDAERKLFELLSLLTDQEKLRLFEILARKGLETVFHLLDTENQALLELKGDRKRIALRLESMSEEQLREILSKIEISAGETISEIDHIDANIRVRA